MIDRNLQILGIARKAGRIAIGGEAVASAVRAGKAKLVLSASDTSDGSLRRARASAKAGRAIHLVIPYTQFELGHIIGRGLTGTVAILDAGLSAKFVRGLAAAEPNRFNGAMELLDNEQLIIAKKRKRTSRRTAL